MSSLRFNGEDEPNLKEYVFENKLGSGTYATVYKAHHKVTFISHT
jgi:serine/threonine protein kinase